MRSDIENITSLDEAIHLLDYVDLLIEMFEKRGLDHSELLLELKTLQEKKQELLMKENKKQ
ncbi:MAG: hypothetical protein JXR62_06930 [Bacilli bacterium]|nr:hypothetical protein [Bacilli bacterium]